jgi:tight adherence protein B
MRPIDVILLLLASGMIYMIYKIVTGKKRKAMQKRIQAVQARRPQIEEAMSLRRKSNEITAGLVYKLTKPLPEFKRLADLLERAGNPVSAKQYLFRRLLMSLVIVFFVVVMMRKPLLLAIPLAFIAGAWLPIKYLQMRINKQNREFLKIFPDAIDLIVRGLRSGLPVSESLVLVSQEVPAPVGPAFSRVSNTMKLGVPLEKALQETAKKLDIAEFNFFTTSIMLQRETGGNLSEILSNLSDVLRARIMMRLKIKAMSSEARASTIIIGALPFVVITAVGVLSPDYMKPLFNDYRGNIWLGIAAGMLGSGLWIMNRMSKFEI